jgi:poly(A) polymerase
VSPSDEQEPLDPPPKAERRPRRRGRKSRELFTYTVEGEEESPPRPVETVPPTRVDYSFDSGLIDADAAKVVQRLVRQGHAAYLVGGCVRDLLLGHKPKDFDVATSARPEEVRDTFRNSRVIGRRFRLVHVLFGRDKVIETATFRRPPSDDGSDDLLIRDDNSFGEAFEDAARRDFTINALFYDIEAKQVLDWCSGMNDIERRSVRTIGDPVIRFREDPVRMLRAVKFCARLDLGMDPDTYRAIVLCRTLVGLAAKPRLFEELLRLLRGGAAHRSMWLLWELGLLDELLPELSAYLYDTNPEDDRVWRLLDRIDVITKERGGPPDDVVLLTLLLLEPLREACAGQVDRVAAAHDFLDVLIARLSMPRRIADAIRRIVASLPRLESDNPGKFARTSLFAQAMDVLEQSRAASPGAEQFATESPRRRRSRRSRRPSGSRSEA